MRVVLTASSLALLVHAAAALGNSQRYPVQPATYASPSRACVLSIDPSDRAGAGPAELELLRDGERVWAARYEHALLDAVVADDGRAVGYALTKGVAERGDHLVVRFDARGNASVVDQWPIRPVGIRDYYDHLLELAWNPTSDVVLARFSTGDPKRAARLFDPPPPRLRGARSPGRWVTADWSGSLLGVSGVPGTPLFVCREIETLLDRRSVLTTTLLDADLRSIWSSNVGGVPLPESFDRAALAARAAGERLFGVPMPSSDRAQPQFGELVRCEVSADSSARSGWRVDVVGSQPWGGAAWPDRTAGRPEARAIALEKIDEVPLGDPALRAAAPIHSVLAWQVSGNGEPEFIRRARDTGFESVRLRADASVASEQRIPAHAVLGLGTRWLPLGAGRWIAAVSAERDAAPQACAYDAAVNALTVLDYAGPAILDAAPAPDGGFYALGEDPTTGGGEFVRRCDARGHELWTLRKHVIEIEGLVPREPFVPRALAPLADGGVLVLDDVGLSNGHVALCSFSADGALDVRRELAIDESVGWAWNPRLSCDAAGNALVSDDYELPYLLLGADGSVQPAWTPTREQDWPYRSDVRIAAEDALWGFGGGCFRRFARDGTIGRRVGSVRAPGRVAEPSAAFVQRDRVYVQDASTGCIHGFTVDGHALDAFAFDPRARAWFDFKARWECEPLGVGPGGRVLFGQLDGSTFASGHDGRWIDEATRGPVIAWTSDGTPLWRLRDEGLESLSADGSIVARVERRADRRFFDGIGQRAARGDGTLITLEMSNRFSADAVHVIAPDGAIVRSSRLPSNASALVPHEIAFEGDWAVVTVGAHAWLYRVSQDRWSDFEPPSADEHSGWSFGIASNGTELWGVELDAMKLHRYRLPE